MALPPRFATSHRLGPATAEHCIEAYWDYTCPFSHKSFLMLTQQIMPYFSSKHPGKVQLIFHHQIQPWHPQSTCLHEAALVVSRIQPSSFWEASLALFSKSRDFYDKNTYEKTRTQIYTDLANLLHSSVLPAVSTAQIMDMLKLKQVDGELNSGNEITDDLKWWVKTSRQLSIHVSPTILIDGLLEPSISSSWTLEQWQEYGHEKWNL